MTTTEIKTIKPGGGGDYVSLNAWDLAEKTNLVTADKIKIAEVYSGGNCITGGKYQPGTWVTNATHYVEIRAAAGEKHQGVYNTAKAYAETSTTGYVFGGFSGSGLKFFRVRDMQLRSTFSDANSFVMVLTDSGGTGNFVVDGCLLLKEGSTFAVLHVGCTTTIKNCVIQRSNSIAGLSGRGVYVNDFSAATATIYNCTIAMQADTGSSIGVRVDSGFTATTQNCYIRAGTCYSSAGTLNKGSKDATINTEATDASLRNIAYSTANFTNVTLGSENLHLVSGSALIDAGADLSGGVGELQILEDFDGNVRPQGSFYDIGADEFFSEVELNEHMELEVLPNEFDEESEENMQLSVVDVPSDPDPDGGEFLFEGSFQRISHLSLTVAEVGDLITNLELAVAEEDEISLPMQLDVAEAINPSCTARTKEEIAEQLKRFLPACLKKDKDKMLQDVYLAIGAVFHKLEIEACELSFKGFIEFADGDWLDLHAADYGTSRTRNESDVALRSRLRRIADKVTKPSIELAVNGILLIGKSFIREGQLDTLYYDRDTYYDRWYYYIDGGARFFVVVIPAQFLSGGNDYYDNYSHFDHHSHWGSAGEQAQIYDQIWALIDSLRAAGVQFVLEIKN